MLKNESDTIAALPFSILSCEGKDAKKFLQGQLTCDLEMVNTTSVTLTAHCNRYGRVVSLFYIYQKENERYEIILPTNLVDLTLTHLRKYAIFNQVKLVDLSHDCYVFGVLDKKDPSILTIPQTPNLYFKITNHLLHATAAYENWHHLQLKAHLVTLRPETSALFLPQEIALDKHGGISLSKGCYLGQEIIARTHYQGKLKYRLHYLTFSASRLPIFGEDLCDEESTIGTIVDYVKIAYNSYGALMLLKNDKTGNPLFFKDKTPLIIE